jgi:DNA-binding CsgD family transcriptional regulator
VSTLCERIYRKLGIRKRAQLAVRLHAIGEG